MNPTAFATAFRHWGDTREGLHLDGVLIALPLRTERRQQRSEEHTSELQSQSNLVCRLLLEKKKNDDTHRRALRLPPIHPPPPPRVLAYRIVRDVAAGATDALHFRFRSTRRDSPPRTADQCR